MNAIACGAILAGLGVAAGAFGAHGLEGRVEPRLLEVFETGARYQIIHALALILVGLGRSRMDGPRLGSSQANESGRSLSVDSGPSSQSGETSGGLRSSSVSSGGGAWLDRAAWCFLAGIVLFSGSLYLMTMTGQRWLGAITPLGGLGFLTGWTCFALAARHVRSRD